MPVTFGEIVIISMFSIPVALVLALLKCVIQGERNKMEEHNSLYYDGTKIAKAVRKNGIYDAYGNKIKPILIVYPNGLYLDANGKPICAEKARELIY